LDRNSNGYLTLNDFEEFMKSDFDMLDKNDIMLLFKRYDRNMDGIVKISEFIWELMPKLELNLWFIIEIS